MSFKNPGINSKSFRENLGKHSPGTVTLIDMKNSYILFKLYILVENTRVISCDFKRPKIKNKLCPSYVWHHLDVFYSVFILRLQNILV